MIDLRCLRLLSDLVMVRVEPGGRFENGLFIPAECQVKHEDAGRIHLITRAGEVVAMGPGKRSKKTGKRIPMDVSIGDRVWFSGWTGQRPQGVPEPTPWGEDTLVMHESELLAAPKEQEPGAGG